MLKAGSKLRYLDEDYTIEAVIKCRNHKLCTAYVCEDFYFCDGHISRNIVTIAKPPIKLK